MKLCVGDGFEISLTLVPGKITLTVVVVVAGVVVVDCPFAMVIIKTIVNKITLKIGPNIFLSPILKQKLKLNGDFTYFSLS